GFTRNFSTTFNARFEKLSTMFNHQPSLRVEPRNNAIYPMITSILSIVYKLTTIVGEITIKLIK
ncbi:hypothetical protein, partial [Arcicella rosea]|uniref:hypothetical protein n=1 Tax=Arcicella rosea TaxID=502909 RepID=UPI001C86DF8C